MNIQGTPGNNSDHPKHTRKYNANGNNSELHDNVQPAVLGQTHLKNTLTAVIHEYLNAKVAAHTKLTIENGGKMPLRVTRPKQPSSNTVFFFWFVLLIG